MKHTKGTHKAMMNSVKREIPWCCIVSTLQCDEVTKLCVMLDIALRVELQLP